VARGRSRFNALRLVRAAFQFFFLAFFVFEAVRLGQAALGSADSNVLLKFDPLAGIVALFSRAGVSTFLTFWPAWIILGLTILSSRFFCAWLCPLGTCFDAVGGVKPRAMRYYEAKGSDIRELRARAEAGTVPRRIRLKYAILAVVLLLSLLGVNLLFFASPLVVMNSAVYSILLPQVPFVLLALLLLAAAYRPRFWCEELCPMGALMSLASKAGKKLPERATPLAVVKDPKRCVSCGACYKGCPFGVQEPFLKKDAGKLASADCTACGDCVTKCPSEGALSLKSFGLPLKRSRSRSGRGVEGVAPRAIGSGTFAQSAHENARFEVTRREFLGSVGLGAVVLVGYGSGLVLADENVLRMPGAQDERAFLAKCNRCQACARACPSGCLKPMGLESGLSKFSTPRFEPREAACVFDQCSQACSAVCPAGAISEVDVSDPKNVRIGYAAVNTRTCRGYKGIECLVCQEKCRFQAIGNNGIKPVVRVARCTGCGSCEESCPTSQTSIKVFPVGVEPEFPGSGGKTRGGTRG